VEGLIEKPSEKASRQKCDKLLYVSMGGACVLHPPSELLHLNQAGVQHLISNLTNTHASTLWHWNGTKVAQL